MRVSLLLDICVPLAGTPTCAAGPVLTPAATTSTQSSDPLDHLLPRFQAERPSGAWSSRGLHSGDPLPIRDNPIPVDPKRHPQLERGQALEPLGWLRSEPAPRPICEQDLERWDGRLFQLEPILARAADPERGRPPSNHTRDSLAARLPLT